MSTKRAIIEKLIANTGITINGSKPYDIKVNNERFYNRALQHGSLGVGESYMEGWWECEQLDEFFFRLFSNHVETKFKPDIWETFHILQAKLINLQTKLKARNDISHHYDIGNDLYEAMLDSLMMYSCGYWKNASTLAEAQEKKLKLICEKLHLKPGMTILDIGCGWGGFAYYAAKNYNVNVVGITISKEQQKIAIERCKGLNVEIRFQDYRDINEQFDRIVSIGMLEHVGSKNYHTFMKAVNKNLKPTGICLLHFIGSNETDSTVDPWINRYIFPNGLIPSLAQIGQAFEKQLIIEDLQNIGLHYDYTLMVWKDNFKRAWPSLKEKYDEAFYRMWIFYLSVSAASFRSRRLNLWQIITTRPDFYQEYIPVRL